MKVYQEKWCDEIERSKGEADDFTLVQTCRSIAADDSGGTNYLTQLLAEEVLRLIKDPPLNNKSD